MNQLYFLSWRRVISAISKHRRVMYADSMKFTIVTSLVYLFICGLASCRDNKISEIVRANHGWWKGYEGEYIKKWNAIKTTEIFVEDGDNPLADSVIWKLAKHAADIEYKISDEEDRLANYMYDRTGPGMPFISQDDKKPIKKEWDAKINTMRKEVEAIKNKIKHRYYNNFAPRPNTLIVSHKHSFEYNVYASVYFIDSKTDSLISKENVIFSYNPLDIVINSIPAKWQYNVVEKNMKIVLTIGNIIQVIGNYSAVGHGGVSSLK